MVLGHIDWASSLRSELQLLLPEPN